MALKAVKTGWGVFIGSRHTVQRKQNQLACLHNGVKRLTHAKPDYSEGKSMLGKHL